ncbi:MAG TPA: LamG domain-containing protein [Sedimentisphaerales bacterium]|nr:LamG domain-containing protein [Sedimentisphaerales bacterium]
MRKVICFTAFILTFTLYCRCACAGEDGPVAWWRFDEGEGAKALDSASQKEDSISGNFTYIRGVAESALKCDGFTTRVVRRAADAPRLEDEFTVEARVLPQEYPWNWCAIVNQEKDHKAGYFFGIDQIGRVGLHLAVNGKWRQCTSSETIPFMEKWSHIAGTFSKDEGITVYIDGKAAATLPVKGKLDFAADMDLQIGRNHSKTLLDPTALVRPGVNFPTSYSFDGIIDELKIYRRRLTPEQIDKNYRTTKPKSPPPLQWRKLPQLPSGPNRFGAIYCRLKFYEEWDALWRVADHPDVVVTFDQGPYKMVFWRGTNFNMNLVTENGRWVGDQSAEGGGPAGCAEHMSDKQCRFAHVRVIENHDARVVVHWRYAIVDVLYNNGAVDPDTGWGAWADEYYYIYPDGIAIRNFLVHGIGGFSVTEPTVLNNPGEKAEDNISLDAVTLANMEGQTRTYNWETWPGDNQGRFKDALPNANICIVNLKSRFKPCYVYEPRSRITPYGWAPELRPEYSHFPTWNHWPVSQAPSDGRYALVPDRVSSSAITSPRVPEPRTYPGSITRTGRFIMGLTDRPVEQLLPLACSWLQPPELKILSKGYGNEFYSRDQRAYILTKDSAQNTQLHLELTADGNSPLVNPAFVIRNWGQANVALRIDGQNVKRGKNFRFGHQHTLDGTDLTVWIERDSVKPVRISLLPAAD